MTSRLPFRQTWLTSDEFCLIPMKALYLLDECIRIGWPLNFDNVEGIGGIEAPDGTFPFWALICTMPESMGGRVWLYWTAYEANYKKCAEQMIRYLRWLKTDVYKEYTHV